MTRDPHDVVRLTTELNPVEAHVLASALQAEGISCRVVGDYLDAGIGDVPGVRAEVWVHQEDLAAAEAILRDHQNRTTDESENEEEP